MFTLEVLKAVIQIGLALNTSPVDVCTVISYETMGTFRTDIQNKRTQATGLIQFMPTTAKWLGTSTQELKNMTVTQQGHYVTLFLNKMGYKSGKYDNNLKSMYSTIFTGSPNYAISKGKGDSYRSLNTIFNRQGKGGIQEHVTMCKKLLKVK